MNFSQQLYAAMRSDPQLPYSEYKGHVFSKGDITALADRIDMLLDQAGVAKNQAIAIIVRNRPLHAAAMLALMSTGRWLTSVYSMQSPENIAQELTDSKFAAIIADAQDWTAPVIAAAKKCGSFGINLDLAAAQNIAPVDDLAALGSGPFRAMDGEAGLEILSSGTTGKPKRILFPMRMLVRAVESVRAGRSGPVQPEILVWPYGGIGGILCLVASTMMDRYTVLLDKFNVDEWVEAAERLKPNLVSGVPTIARMILDAKVPPEKLSSIEYFYGGSAPMTPELQDEFERIYGIKVIWAYGATEFCGTIICWTPDLHTEFKDSKKGAMGRALPGIGLRVMDMENGNILGVNEEGYLAAHVPVISDEWITTTDIVTIDEDGFVFHKGRGDGAILRGGHKVLPEKLVDTLRAHPDILDAAVVGMADDRLGEVPVAAVELCRGVDAPDEAALLAHMRAHLSAPQIPKYIKIWDRLPRTASMKVDLAAVKKRLSA